MTHLVYKPVHPWSFVGFSCTGHDCIGVWLYPHWRPPPVRTLHWGLVVPPHWSPGCTPPLGLVVPPIGAGCTPHWGWLYPPLGLAVPAHWGWLYPHCPPPPMGLVVPSIGAGCTPRHWGWLYPPLGLAVPPIGAGKPGCPHPVAFTSRDGGAASSRPQGCGQ